MTESEISILPDTTVPITVQFILASIIYFILSRLFPAHETMFDHAILDQETLPDDGNISGSDEKKEVDDYRVDETGIA
jgi:NCS1 family nucleobase:cation symporter-1